MNITELRATATSKIIRLLQTEKELVITSRTKPIFTIIPPRETTKRFFINPDAQVNRHVQAYPELKKIAEQPQGIWLGEWSGGVWSTVTNILNKVNKTVPVFVLYNIPGRDNGNYSSGGLPAPQAYYEWISAIADALEGKESILILEPDAVGLSRNIPNDKKNERLAMLKTAIGILKENPSCQVFLDASMWVGIDENVHLLKQAGLDAADGVSINVSGYDALEDCLRYGREIAQKTGKKYVIDTSRNGNGKWANPNNEADPWCNPPGRKLGVVPTEKTDDPNCIAYLWIKSPGESDGTCRNAPRAGEFWIEYALGLVRT